MRRLLTSSLCACLIVVGASGVAAAQEKGQTSAPVDRETGPTPERKGAAAAPRQGGRAAPLPRRGGPMTPQQLDQAFDRFMVTQARSDLQLSDRQFAEFGPLLERLQRVRRQAQRQRRLLVNDVNQLTQGAAEIDDATVAAKLKAIEDQNAQADAEIRQAYQAIDAVLIPGQRLRFRAFEARMERRKLELISRAQQRARAPAARQAP